MSTVGETHRFAFDPTREPFNLFAPGVMDDPYPYYAALRDRDPVHHNPDVGMFFLSRYEDVALVGRDHRRFIRDSHLRHLYDDYAEAVRVIMGGNLFLLDPPDHTRLKRLIGPAFTTSRVEALRPRIEEVCGQVLDEAGLSGQGGSFELVTSLGYPLPLRIICEILGIPEEDHSEFRQWSNDFVIIVDPFPTPEQKVRAEAAIVALADYFTELIAARRRAVRAGLAPPGLVTALAELAEAGEKVSADEMVMLCTMLLVAGYENVTNLISNTLRALLENPEQLAALRRDHGLYANLPDEGLRYYSTTQYNTREVAEDVVVAGTTIPVGALVVLLRGSANRDGRRFANPDVFDLRRPDSADHVGFGESQTFCTGAGLARIEVEVAIRMLLDRVSELHITRWVPGPTRLFWGPREVHLQYQ